MTISNTRVQIKAEFGQNYKDLGTVGRVGENGSREIVFDCADVLTQFPGASIVCVIKRACDTRPYSAPLTEDGYNRILPLLAVENAAAGQIMIELRAVSDDTVLKSAMFSGRIAESLQGEGDTPGNPAADMLNRINDTLGAAVKTQEKLLSALDDVDAATSRADAAAKSAGDTETTIKDAETERERAETSRQTTEKTRQDAEAARTVSEAARTMDEKTRQSAETQRQMAEGTRVSNETARVNAESDREIAETARSQAEQARAAAESNRVATENIRQAALTSAVNSATTSATSAEGSASAASNSASAAQEAQEAVEGFVQSIAKEPTAQQILAVMQQELTLLNQLVENGMGGSGSLNGFSFSRGENDELIISYVNPDDETDTATSTFATKTLANLIAQELASINESLHTITGMEQTAQTEG